MYQYDDARFGESTSKKLKCTKCGVVFDIKRPDPDAEAGERTNLVGVRRAEETTKQYTADRTGDDAADEALPQLAPLPVGQRFSLAVILGANAGQIFTLRKPRVFLGRGAGCDVVLQDSEVSRRHAMLEIRGDGAMMSDLGSTNGTFVDGTRIQKAALASHQEFSLGTTTLMYIVTEVQEPH
jgi:hypothetical protein